MSNRTDARRCGPPGPVNTEAVTWLILHRGPLRASKAPSTSQYSSAMLYEDSGCVGLRGSRTLQARVSSRRRAGLRQYRSREGSRKRSSLGRRRLTHWIDLSATSPSPLEVQGALNETDPVLVASRKRRSARTGLRGDGPGGGHRQVAISMAEAGARRQRPAPSESFSVSLGMKRLCRLYDALRCREIETTDLRGADSAIGDFRREFGRILQLHPPLAPKTLACTDWVAFHYI